MLPPPRAIVAPPPLASFTAVRNVSANSLAELPPSSGAPEIDATELVISLPAPMIREPLELNVLFAVPTMLLAIPA